MKQDQDQKPAMLPDDRRERIKKAALKVFAKWGLQAAKISMIAEEAGVSQGLSYRYFSSKEELFTMLVQEALDQAETSLADISRLPGSPKERLRAFTLTMLDESHKSYFLLLRYAQIEEGVPEQTKQILASSSPDRTIGKLVPLFQQGQQAGEFTEGEPEKLLFFYFSVITGLMLQDTPGIDGGWRNEVDRLMKLILK
ncbi:TetR/AcrR family transcriptional regulator [Paenibacillus sp. GCM10023248]|uniref:TetR/AcrR family transcriptional regulator n=1 Tax=Bacillales TaxID=1385 RepID=UPI002378725A|nr:MULTISPECIES: TetR/AcrR family transcriptional regulator [Bacillales]MDD9270508.1 TetR/AcrR family transcriptional regulator [Paenibacillus sp. MAHUQ-63]MDR6884127.1 AcrR family transcriptional regulator [Bacillus sp. 3255]